MLHLIYLFFISSFLFSVRFSSFLFHLHIQNSVISVRKCFIFLLLLFSFLVVIQSRSNELKYIRQPELKFFIVSITQWRYRTQNYSGGGSIQAMMLMRNQFRTILFRSNCLFIHLFAFLIDAKWFSYALYSNCFCCCFDVQITATID